MDAQTAERLADELITAELAKQQMWGPLEKRTDIHARQLMLAGMAQLDALDMRQAEIEDAFDEQPIIYPSDWSGFRDYGSDVANLVVAVAFLTQEIKRKLMNGENYTRTSRRPEQAYNPATGLPTPTEG